MMDSLSNPIFSFVILHYRTADDTIKCVNSILSLNEEYSNVVIVDNASENGSIEIIEEHFKSNKNIYILKNNKNLGFASGNNIGYLYAKNILNSSFIAILNNDIVLASKDFIKEILNFYEKEHFYVMGPDIISEIDGGHQNPMKLSYRSKADVTKEIFRYRLLMIISKIGIYDLLKPSRKVRTGSVRKEIQREIQYDVTLHGSCIIFSKEYIDKENMAFREGTFLYAEEAILARYCQNKRYRMIFDPFIKVYHKEDSASNSVNISNKKRREFVFKNMIKSLKVYRNYFN